MLFFVCPSPLRPRSPLNLRALNPPIFDCLSLTSPFRFFFEFQLGFPRIVLTPNRAVSFLPHTASPGFTLPYPVLTLHALTPATPDAPAHLYCQVDESDRPSAAAGAANGGGEVDGDLETEEEGEGEGEGEYTPMRELRVYLPEAKCVSFTS